MKRPVSIRASLLRNLIVMLAVIGIAIVVTATLGSRRAVRVFSESLVGRSIETVESRLDGFFAGPARQLRLLRDQARAGLLGPPGGAALADAARDARIRLLAPVIEAYPQVSAVILADTRGHEHMLLREGGRWRSREMRRDVWGSEARWLEWTDGETPTSRTEQLDYDPRLRPWFTGALAAGPPEVHWTEPYTFFTSGQPGITASIAWDAGEGVTNVIGLDVELRGITSFTRSIQVGQRGLAGVLTDDRRLIGLPRGERFDDAAEQDAAFLKHPEEIGLTLFADAARAIGRTIPDQESVTARFTSGREPWWGRVTPYRLSPQRRLHIAIAVPEADLIGSLQVQRWILIGIVLAVLVVGAARAIVLSRRFSAPIEALVVESERLSRGDFDPGPPNPSRVAEVRRLAEAHDRMREGLRSLIRLNKLERDLDLARDIQRGLFPKAPPEAPGFSIAGWNQAADETGGDYYDWITLPDGRTVVTLADVTGHGVGPALIVSVCRAYMRATTAFRGRHLAEALAQVNDLLCDDTPPERFVTAAVAMVEPGSGMLTLISAGQGPMLFYRSSDGSVLEWDGDEPPLAVVRGLTFPNPRQVTMTSGDALVLTTDGFFEWRNPAGERFGIPRLKDFVAAHHDLGPQAFIESLYAAVRAHAAGTPQADDLTAVVIRRE